MSVVLVGTSLANLEFFKKLKLFTVLDVHKYKITQFKVDITHLCRPIVEPAEVGMDYLSNIMVWGFFTFGEPSAEKSSHLLRILNH